MLFSMPSETIGTGSVVTLVIAESSSIDCQLLANAIRRNHTVRLLGHATTSESLVAMICTRQPDVALISVRLSDGPTAGFSALRKLRILRSQCRTVILLDQDHAELVVEAFRGGAKGIFCRSDGTCTALMKCIRRVHQGQIWLSNRGIEHIVGTLMVSRPARVSRFEFSACLSKREQEVARLVTAGLSNREIAGALNLSEHTVKNYLFHIFDKMNISTRTELVLHMLTEAKPAEATGTPAFKHLGA
jgi:DNA-binding NarL/FixJ family response regulator